MKFESKMLTVELQPAERALRFASRALQPSASAAAGVRDAAGNPAAAPQPPKLQRGPSMATSGLRKQLFHVWHLFPIPEES